MRHFYSVDAVYWLCVLLHFLPPSPPLPNTSVLLLFSCLLSLSVAHSMWSKELASLFENPKGGTRSAAWALCTTWALAQVGGTEAFDLLRFAQGTPDACICLVNARVILSLRALSGGTGWIWRQTPSARVMPFGQVLGLAEPFLVFRRAP